MAIDRADRHFESAEELREKNCIWGRYLTNCKGSKNHDRLFY